MLTILAATILSAGQGPIVEAAQGVLHRLLHGRAGQFELSQIPAESGKETFTVEAHDGKAFVAGSSSVAICRGAYEYLKNACHCQVSWSGDNLALPARLPDYPRRKVSCSNQYRHYFNVCTFGYTTVWWDWNRWQHEIDWMAMHGINMPLAMNGQEKVWQRLFRELGEPKSSIDAHFTGAAFLPWHRMGNVDKHMGPLPQSWIDGQAELQKRILGRERELGMHPVVPGFSGFVPVDFDKLHPGVKLFSPAAWAGFEATKFIDPRSPLFVEIGRKFIQEYREEFGSDHLYLCDTFNEMDPQFEAATELADLRATGNSVYDAIRQADPDGVWVMQGWLFYNARGYWKPERTEAMLGGVPQGKLIVLDLATSEHAVWSEQPTVRRAGWIYNTLHNYGQTTHLYGDLQGFADAEYRSLSDPNHGLLLGMGLTPEGIDQNPVIYELMTDLMWRDDHVDVGKWLEGYIASRYGSASPASKEAWKNLLATVYGGDGAYKNAWRDRPNLGVGTAPFDEALVREATRMLLEDSPKLQSGSPYRRDLVDITKTWLGGLADCYLTVALASFDDDKPTYQSYKNKFFEALNDLDRIMATRPEHRLTTWVADARKWGKTAGERDQMERNARMQVTVWGGPELYDYANKEWAGLNDDFLAQRWHLFFDALEKAGSASKLDAPDFLKWETDWAMSTKPIRESKPEDSVAVATEILHKYGKDSFSPEELLHIDADPGIAVGRPVTDSGGTEGSDHRPELAVDGKITGGYWSASPAPQWLQIDLKSVQKVGTVWLFPYYGDGRYYQYKVDVSNDAVNWRTVVDQSANTVPSTFRGYKNKFPPVDARYVRVTMLKNSANIGVHLYEMRVYR